MARHRLTDRVQALEGWTEPNKGPATWILAEPDENKDQAIARYQEAHGNIGNYVLIWTGVPRRESGLCA